MNVTSLVLKMRSQTARALVPWLVDDALETKARGEHIEPERLALARAVESGLTIGRHKARLVVPDKLPIVRELIRVLAVMEFADIHSNFKAAARRLLVETRAFRRSAVDKLADVSR